MCACVYDLPFFFPSAKSSAIEDEKAPTPPEASKPRIKSISFRLTKSASSGRLKDSTTPPPPAEQTPPADQTTEVAPAAAVPSVQSLRPSASCNVLPGMNNYSSDSEDDEGGGEASRPPSLEEDGDESMQRTLAAVLEVPSGEFMVLIFAMIHPLIDPIFHITLCVEKSCLLAIFQTENKVSEDDT